NFRELRTMLCRLIEQLLLETIDVLERDLAILGETRMIGFERENAFVERRAFGIERFAAELELAIERGGTRGLGFAVRVGPEAAIYIVRDRGTLGRDRQTIANERGGANVDRVRRRGFALLQRFDGPRIGARQRVGLCRRERRFVRSDVEARQLVGSIEIDIF